MSKLRNKLDYLYHSPKPGKEENEANNNENTNNKNNEDSPPPPTTGKTESKTGIKEQWQNLNSQTSELSTREKLEKLVNLSLKRDKRTTPPPPPPSCPEASEPNPIHSQEAILIRDFTYPLDVLYGPVTLADWHQVTPRHLEIIFGETGTPIEPMKLVFFDSETTGLSGGTGTIPFLLGFGFFNENIFQVRVFILNDLSAENIFLEEVDRFLDYYQFSGTITFNGKSFDFPLMEGRYILQRKRFPLLRFPHYDFLFPARTIWKNTYDSRKLGYLGSMLTGISREEDIDSSQIPMLYFNYLRSRAGSMIEKIVEHNALDLLGLAVLVLLGAKYLDDISYTRDEGEILGIARLHETYGDIDRAQSLYETLKESATRTAIASRATKGLAIIKKRKKLYREAGELWEVLSHSSDLLALRELSIHFEHREKDDRKALEYVRQALETLELTPAQRNDFLKRLERLTKRLDSLDNDF